MNFLRINNRKNFLLREVPSINPHSRRYVTFYREQVKRCIEGFWSIDDASVDVDILPESPEFPLKSSSWRYITPNCYFYVNFTLILANKKGASSGAKVPMRPNLDDVEWEFGYNWMEARGFSGFEFDDEFSCNKFLLDKNLSDEDLRSKCLNSDGEIIELLYNNYFTKKGLRKIFVPCREYIRRLFDKPMGRPIYGNIPKNLMILGTRDGGKSWLTAGCIISHELLFDGRRYYDRNTKELPVAEIVVGAAISDKSRDLLNKVQFIVDNLPGTWKKGSSEQIPSPFLKHMSGSLGANKEWYHKYDKYFGGEKTAIGTGSRIKHRVFTTSNPESAAGGRAGTVVVEEVGLVENLLTIHGSNTAAMNDSAIKFGSAMYIGTSGNMAKIVGAESIFNHPSDFDMLEFDNIWERDANNKICWFIPATHMARRFKDSNGNTLIKEATEHFNKERQRKQSANNRKALDLELMNYPLVPSEMFINASNNLFPVNDLKNHYSRLMTSKKMLDESYKVEFFITESGKIDFKHVKKHPIREYPLGNNDDIILDGCPEIFEMPYKDDGGNVPNGLYISGLDPIDDDDNSDNTRSLQSMWIMNRLTGRLVFEYTGRTKLASEFYEQCRRALIFYNAKCNYENNKKGFYGHLYNKASLYLLVETPEILIQKDMQKSRGVGNKALGTNVGNTDIKAWGLELVLQWLLEQAFEMPDGVLNLHTIKSPALLKELILYNPDGNFDRISALITLMILREDKKRFVVSQKKKVRSVLDDEFFKKTWEDKSQ